MLHVHFPALANLERERLQRQLERLVRRIYLEDFGFTFVENDKTVL